jgi:hypothetical protein
VANPNITKVYIDTAFDYNGHVWELKLNKPPYVLRNVELNTRIRKVDKIYNLMAFDTLSVKYAAFQSLSHTKFSMIGNTTMILQNLANDATYLEAKPSKVMTTDTQIKWNATIQRNCFEVSLISENYPSFTAVLKCLSMEANAENYYYFYGIQGTMAAGQSSYTYNHFIVKYNSLSDDFGPMQAVAAPAADHFIVLLQFTKNSSAVMYAVNNNAFVPSTSPIGTFGVVIASSAPITGVTMCNLVKCKATRGCFVSVCSSTQPGQTKFLSMSSSYVFDTSISPYNLPFYPLNQYCNLNEYAAKNLIRCIYATPTELMMYDFDEEASYELAVVPATQSNPRKYVLLQDYEPSTITFSRNFIGYIGKQMTYNINEAPVANQITPTPPNWAFVVYHITSDGLLNFTTHINQIYSYAAYVLPKGSSQQQSIPFHESKIFPYMESVTWTDCINSTNKTLTTLDTYFLFQEASGDIYSHKIEPYVLTVLNNHTKIKTFLDESSFTNDQGSFSSPIAASTLFENLRPAAKTTVVAAATTDSGVSNTAATSMILIGCAATALVVGASLYFLFREKKSSTKTLDLSLRHESGVLRL